MNNLQNSLNSISIHYDRNSNKYFKAKDKMLELQNGLVKLKDIQKFKLHSIKDSDVSKAITTQIIENKSFIPCFKFLNKKYPQDYLKTIIVIELLQNYNNLVHLDLQIVDFQMQQSRIPYMNSISLMKILENLKIKIQFIKRQSTKEDQRDKKQSNSNSKNQIAQLASMLQKQCNKSQYACLNRRYIALKKTPQFRFTFQVFFFQQLQQPIQNSFQVSFSQGSKVGYLRKLERDKNIVPNTLFRKTKSINFFTFCEFIEIIKEKNIIFKQQNRECEKDQIKKNIQSYWFLIEEVKNRRISPNIKANQKQYNPQFNQIEVKQANQQSNQNAQDQKI